MKFNDTNKEVKEFNNKYFGFGVHRVQISAIELGKSENGKEFMEITVVDPEDGEITDSSRVWFTTDAAINYSFNVLRQIFVHNTPEDKRDSARDLFDKVTDTSELEGVLQGLIGKECWLTKYPSADRTYTNKAGQVKPSIDTNVMGYEPKVQSERIPARNTDNDELTRDNLHKVFPGSETQDVPFESTGDAKGSTVPASDAWSK